MARSGVNRQGYATCVTITNSDTVAIAPTDAILVLTAGNLVMIDMSGNSTTATVAVGQVIPVRLVRINATSSTATAAALYF